VTRHRDVLGALIRGTDDERRAAAEHVARCSDCDGLLALLGLGAGDAAPRADDVGCEAVRDVMHELVTLDAGAMETRHPGAVRHLGWCLACRDRLADVLEIDAAFADGALSMHLLPAEASAGWRDRAGDVREMIGRILVRVRDRVAHFAELAAVVSMVPAMALEPSRGGGEAAGTRIVRLDLQDRAAMELLVTAVGTDRVELELRTDDATAGVWMVQVRDLADESAFVAAQTLRPGTPMVLKGLPAGRYRLEIMAPDRRSWWVPLDVSTA
jgi:hypothetical protein